MRYESLFFIVSNGEWDKKEKIGESYLIREGETIRVSELETIGIEPLEIKAVDARPVVLKPGEGPRITNTASLEVEKLERHFGFYLLWLKNKSDKNIVVLRDFCWQKRHANCARKLPYRRRGPRRRRYFQRVAAATTL